MAKIIAVANQKGGVGKTTTSVNLAASLAATKRRVCLVDLDPQGNATMGIGVDKHGLLHSNYQLLMNEADVKQVLVSVPAVGVDVLPANDDLTAAEVALPKVPGGERRLAEALATLGGEYHYIIIDCPPSLNMLTVNALAAADGVLIPMQCEYYALEGLSALMQTIEQIKQSINPKLELEGILRTMFDPRNNLSNEVADQLILHFEDKVYNTIIPRNVRLAEAPSFGLPALLHDKTSRGAMAYLALAGEVNRRQPAQPKPRITYPTAVAS